MKKTFNFSKKTDPRENTSADKREDIKAAKKSFKKKLTMGKQKK